MSTEHAEINRVVRLEFDGLGQGHQAFLERRAVVAQDQVRPR